MPEYDAERVQKVTQELLQRYRSANPKNWIELQQAAGSVMVNATIPRKLPKFDPNRVGPAVEQLASSIASQNPGSWQELGQILNRFTGVIPAAVMENIIAFRVLQRQASDKNEDNFAKNDPASGKGGDKAAGQDEKPVPSGLDRLNPNAREAVEKELDNNIGKFSGFMSPASPIVPNFGAFPQSVTGSSNLPGGNGAAGKNGDKGNGKDDGSRWNTFFSTARDTATPPASNPGLVPVLSEEKSSALPTLPADTVSTVPPMIADDKKVPVVTAPDTKPTLLTGTPKAVAADGLLNSIVSQLPKTAVAAYSPTPPKILPSLVDKAKKAEEKEIPRKNGVRLGQIGPSGRENGGVAGEGTGEWPTSAAGESRGWLGSAADWLLSALGLKDPDGADDEGKGLADSEPYLRAASEFGDFAGAIDSALGRKVRSRVVASVSDKTGMSVTSASRLYYGALTAAWASTAGLLAFAWRRVRRKKT